MRHLKTMQLEEVEQLRRLIAARQNAAKSGRLV
jgi:hypothetical protein